MGKVAENHSKLIRVAPKAPPQIHAQTKPAHKPTSKRVGGPTPTAEQKRHLMPSPSGRKSSSVQNANSNQARFVLQDSALRQELTEKYDFRDKDYDHLKEERPKLFSLTLNVAQHTELSMNYLVATMYVETNLTISMKGDAKGLGQFKTLAWQKVTVSDEFQTIWKKVAPGIAIPSKPGSSPTADVVAIAAWTKIREGDLWIDGWSEGELKDMARRLAYHLTDATAFKKISELDVTGKVTFSDPDNQTNWRRFLAVLTKENAPTCFAKAK